jgi:hypothetical protein
MKTQPRRLLQWGTLLCAVAGVLTGATRPVHADNLASSAVASATDRDVTAASPYFWTMAQLTRGEEDWHCITDTSYWVGAGHTLGTVGLRSRSLSSRALD